MRVYTGHQIDDPQGAFLVFARTRQEALDYLANEEIEVDEESLKPVGDSGVVLYRADPEGQPTEAEEVRLQAAACRQED